MLQYEKIYKIIRYTARYTDIVSYRANLETLVRYDITYLDF